jgi:hypothetical protein
MTGRLCAEGCYVGLSKIESNVQHRFVPLGNATRNRKSGTTRLWPSRSRRLNSLCSRQQRCGRQFGNLRLRGRPCLRSQALGQDPEAIGEWVLACLSSGHAEYLVARRHGWAKLPLFFSLAGVERRMEASSRAQRLAAT